MNEPSQFPPPYEGGPEAKERLNAREAAAAFVASAHPDCLLAVLGGSAGRSASAAPGSDLDVVVVERAEPDAFRRVTTAFGWVVEVFRLSPSTYRDAFDEGIAAANPSLQRMLAEGTVIRSSAVGDRIVEEAKADLAFGPMPWSDAEIDYARYMIANYLDDVVGALSRAERWFAAIRLIESIAEFALRANGRWSGDGKHLHQQLAAFSPAAAKGLEEAIEALFGKDDDAPLVDLCLRTLEPFGGPLTIGYEG